MPSTRTLNIPSRQHSLANPRPTDAIQHARYIRVATICTCPVTKIDNPGTPRMCEYCDLFHHVIRTSPTKVCPACAMPNADANNLSTCPICVIYALLYQNMFAQRWNDIQTVVPTTRCAQIHASHNSLQRKECATSPHKRGLPIGSNVPTATVSTASSTHMFVNLALTENTLGTIRNILATLPATHRCTNIPIPHPVMPLTTERLVNLQGSIRSGTDEQLTLALLFHHFHLTALSELIPNDRTLELTKAAGNGRNETELHFTHIRFLHDM